MIRLPEAFLQIQTLLYVEMNTLQSQKRASFSTDVELDDGNLWLLWLFGCTDKYASNHRTPVPRQKTWPCKRRDDSFSALVFKERVSKMV